MSQPSPAIPEAVMLRALPPRPLHVIVEEMGIGASTIRRWEKAGFIKSFDLNGVRYVTAAEIARFNARLEAGEFTLARPIPVPRRRGRERRGLPPVAAVGAE